jgi:hypothetical protein
MADGGMVVLVALSGVHVLPPAGMPPILGDVGMLVPVHLGVVTVGVGHGDPPPAWPCLPARTRPGCRSSIPRLTAKLTAKSADNRGSRRTTLDGYTRPELRRRDRR